MVSRSVKTVHSFCSENDSENTTKSNMQEGSQVTWSNREASIDHLRKASNGTSPKRSRAPSNNTGEATRVSVEEVRPTQTKKNTKRKASSELLTTRKRLWVTSNNTGEATRVSVEEVRPTQTKKNTKRKASSELLTTRKRLWVTSNNTGEANQVSVEEVRPTEEKKGIKRKASSELQTSSKRLWVTSNNTGEANSVSVEEVRPTEEKKGIKRKTSSEIKMTRKRLWVTSNNTGEATTVSVDNVRPTEREENPKQQPDTYTEHLWTEPSPYNTSRDDFENKYEQFEKLGQGAFGCVYAGYRRSDNLPVAIKHIRHDMVSNERVVLNGRTYRIPVEVLIMQRMAGGPESVGTSAAVSLIDWYTLDKEVVLVIERPVPCKDLKSYVKEALEEHQAKNIMRQLVHAAIEMSSKGVFHKDIKLVNLLVETGSDVPRVRVIDFGISRFVEKIPFAGTSDFDTEMKKRTDLTTVRQLGAALLEMLVTDKELRAIPHFFMDIGFIGLNVTQDCRDFLKMCLNLNPQESVTLEELQQHLWIKT